MLTLRAEVLQPDNGWAQDVVDYKCGEVIDVVNGKFRCITQWQVVAVYPNGNNIVYI